MPHDEPAVDERHRYPIPDPFPVEVEASPSACFALPDTPLGARLAEAEAVAFPEAPELFAEEPSSLMLGMAVDGMVRHVMRLSVPALATEARMPFLLRDLVASGQGLAEPELLAHYEAAGVDLATTVSVESNVRVGAKVEGEISSADLAYLSVFDVMRRVGSGAVFAHLNEAARSSFRRVGLRAEDVAGHEGLRTPGVEPGTYDDLYQPVCIPRDEGNVAVIEALSPVMPAAHWEPRPPEWWTAG